MACSCFQQHSWLAQRAYKPLKQQDGEPIRRTICRIEDSPNDPVKQQESNGRPEPAPVASSSCNRNKELIAKYLNHGSCLFGPAYRNDSDPLKKAKKEAWDYILEKSLDKEELKENPDEELKENRKSEVSVMYQDVIKKLERDAKNTYAAPIHNGWKNSRLKKSDFNWMMITDGCFFLQVALHILGGTDLLDYHKQHMYFGSIMDEKVIKRTILAMFFIGNQIPYVVLRALMKQPFFQDVIKKGTWKLPSDLPRLALYLLLVHPELDKRGTESSPRFFPKLMHEKNDVPQIPETPSDLLHALHCIVLGNENDPSDSESKDALDVEAGVEDYDKKIKFPSATELQQKGIGLEKAKQGIREIHFGKKFLIFPALYIPPFTFDDYTEPILEYLQSYEIQQEMSKGKREVNAHVRFLADLIQTQQDVKILEKKGIIKVEKKEKYTLPFILSRLASDTSSEGIVFTQNLRLVKTAIDDYSPLPKRLVSLGLIFGLIEIVFTILQYVAPRGSN